MLGSRWADALKSERLIKIRENEMCVEEIASRKLQIHVKRWLLVDLQLELDDVYRYVCLIVRLIASQHTLHQLRL